MKRENNADSFLNMIVNSSVIFDGLMTEAITGALGNVAAGVTEGVANARGNAGTAKRKGAEVRRKVSRKVPAMVRETVESMLSEKRAEFGTLIDGMTPGQRKDFLADIGDASYVRAFEAIRKHDFGLPGLTERLSVDDVVGYIELARKEDPRFTEVMERVNSVKEPRFFAGMGNEEGPAEGENEEEFPEIDTVSPTIRKLPASYLFPPGAETTISLRGNKELKLRWDADPGRGRSFDDFGIMVRQGTTATKAPFGGMTLYSENGKITATMKNLEAFPLAVGISAEK
jgi:hypothetical protein